jgi:ketosteroid isomerase-like protein
MKKLVYTLGITTILSLNSICSADGEAVPEAIMRLEREWSAAVLGHDIATVERLIAGDFVGIDGRGLISDKAGEIREATASTSGPSTPAFEILSEVLSDMTVRVYGNVAICTALNSEKARFKGKEISPRYRRTTVWIQRDGSWRCVSFHASRILDEP